MKKHLLVFALAVLAAVSAYMRGPTVQAAVSPLNCNLSAYKAGGGLTAGVAGDVLTVAWDGDKNQEMRLRLAIDSGTPTIQELAVRKKGGAWGVVAAHVTPEYRVASGRRRNDSEGAGGLRGTGISELTPGRVGTCQR